MDAFSEAECEELLCRLAGFHPARWFHRPKVNSLPTGGDPTSDYFFCGNRQQDREFSEYLKSLAPVIEGATLSEWCVNRYDVGGYMPEHFDHDRHRYNMTIPLCGSGDGVTIDGVFREDVPGQGIVFRGVGLPHEVKPVKHQRYVIIYLYE